MLVYLCLSPGALLNEASRQGRSYGITLKTAADSVAQSESNQLLEEEEQQKTSIMTFSVVTLTYGT